MEGNSSCYGGGVLVPVSLIDKTTLLICPVLLVLKILLYHHQFNRLSLYVRRRIPTSAVVSCVDICSLTTDLCALSIEPNPIAVSYDHNKQETTPPSSWLNAVEEQGLLGSSVTSRGPVLADITSSSSSCFKPATFNWNNHPSMNNDIYCDMNLFSELNLSTLSLTRSLSMDTADLSTVGCSHSVYLSTTTSSTCESDSSNETQAYDNNEDDIMEWSSI